jgi:Ca-activated chloride channel family protein
MNRRRYLRGVLLTLIFGTLPVAALARGGNKTEAGRTLRTETELTLVNVSVTDPSGSPVTGLQRQNFRIFENGTEQGIVKFSTEDVPVSIGVILDTSESMDDKVYESRLAALKFFVTANPRDEFFLVDFNDRAQLVKEFTGSVEELQSYLEVDAQAHGETALYDGVYLGLSHMNAAQHARKALLLISDGGDNHSRYNEGDVRRFVQEADVQLYTIGLFGHIGGYRIEELNGPFLLNDLTEMTGGRAFTAHNSDELSDIATKISMLLRSQYVIGYHPADLTHDGKWRKIKVKLRPPQGLPPLRVEAKNGYFAPGR